jgi:pimeloyl-ACP methyl ester carboxylesterase/2-polyprenyl-6-methoxyphenol hydroxylase-like FAD-dependent oxidoreductase
MGKEFDVVVVGGRCAGSPLATLLARAGLSVALVEQATFPRDTLSTHVFQSAVLAFLKRLGVLSALQATGAPVVNHFDIRQEGFRARVLWPLRPGDVGGGVSVRRLLLDPILMDAAVEAGAEAWMGAKVTALVRERGRVTGVRVTRNGSEQALEAKLVVGADGRNSAVARLAGSRKYNLTTNERAIYWSFFEGADPGAEPTAIFHRWSGNFVIAMPADSGLYQVITLPELSELPRFRRSLEESYLEYARRCDPVAHALSDARRVGKLFGMPRWEGFFREATGPGWVLAGDAGHFKDPSPAQGIQDAFRQVEFLAPAILGAIGRSPSALDEALAGWARWRDDDAGEHYWLATDLGKAGLAPAVLPEIAQRLYEQGNLDSFLDLFNHQSTPSKVLTPPRLAGATARLLPRRGCDRRALLGEVGTLIAEDVRRKRLARYPHYVPLQASVDAGPTEIEDDDAGRSQVSTSTLEVSVRGVRSRVLTAGPPDGPEAVVFVHGNPGPADDWRDLLSRAGELGRAIAPDMPGYGHADTPKDFSYSVDGYADYLAALLDQLGIIRAHIVAHDFGGLWALAWAARHPGALASATLINTGVLIDYRWHHYARIWRTPILGEVFQATTSRPAFRMLLGRENPRLTRDQVDRIYDASRSWATRRAVLKLYRATPAAKLAGPAAALRPLDRPALVIWGTEDAYLPYEQAERQRQAFPSAHVEHLTGHGHWMMLEDPERVASLVISFLRRQLPDPATATESSASPPPGL